MKDLNPSEIVQASQENKPDIGGGLPVISFWAEKTLQPKGPMLWKTLLHKSSCLSCAWGTGGQKGGFHNEDEEVLQRCAKSVEAISAELMEPIESHFFERYTISQLQQLSSKEADHLGRLSFPVIKRANSDHYERISWEEIYSLVVKAFQKEPERLASYSSGTLI